MPFYLCKSRATSTFGPFHTDRLLLSHGPSLCSSEVMVGLITGWVAVASAVREAEVPIAVFERADLMVLVQLPSEL